MRILIVEDNPERERILRSWLPASVRAIVATSGGRAIGILARDRGATYGAIVLDHDLGQRCASDRDAFLSGQDVAEAIMRNVSREVPILVHSVNAIQGPVMVRRLQRAGYEVLHLPMDCLTREVFVEWVRDAEEDWNSRKGDNE